MQVARLRSHEHYRVVVLFKGMDTLQIEPGQCLLVSLSAAGSWLLFELNRASLDFRLLMVALYFKYRQEEH